MTKQINPKLKENDIKFIYKNICRDYDVTNVKFEFHKSEICFCPGFQKIWFKTTAVPLNIVLHELAHHIQYERTGATDHRVNFHRLCFDIRDWFKESYGIDCPNVNMYSHTESYVKALSEWKQKKIDNGTWG